MRGTSLRAPLAEARFSPCGSYRWWLGRRWDLQRPALLFIGLNPSRATADRDDPTLRRLQSFARAWGYGSLEVLNLFARISASPAVLRRCADPVGAANDAWLDERLRALPARAAVWLGWGNGGAWRDRDRQVLALLGQVLPAANGPALLVLGFTASGRPRHPLYAAGDARPQRLLHPGAELCPAVPFDGPISQSLCDPSAAGGWP